MKICKDYERDFYNDYTGEYESCVVETIERELDRHEVIEAVAYTVTRRLIPAKDFKSIDRNVRQDIEQRVRDLLMTMSLDIEEFDDWMENYYENDIYDYYIDELLK